MSILISRNPYGVSSLRTAEHNRQLRNVTNRLVFRLRFAQRGDRAFEQRSGALPDYEVKVKY